MVIRPLSKPSEKIIKRRVVLPDGRYLIFYIFEPADIPDSLRPQVAESETLMEAPGEET